MNFVYYRLPHTQQVFRGVMRKEPEELASLAELNGRRGFVIAPFAPSDDCPILLLDVEWEPMELPADTMAEASLVDADFAKEQESYAIDFENFHAQLRDGTFSKIVLARSARLTATEDVSPLTLFARLAVVILVCLWRSFPRNAAARGSLPLQRCSFAVGVTR